VNKLLYRQCRGCGNLFTTYRTDQVYCCRECYRRAKNENYVPAQYRKKEAVPVRIRVPKPLPVFPEFQLKPGKVYKAQKRQCCDGIRATYIVTLDEKHRTIVRQEECEEVPNE
jgi:hypothetical protein